MKMENGYVRVITKVVGMTSYAEWKPIRIELNIHESIKVEDFIKYIEVYDPQPVKDDKGTCRHCHKEIHLKHGTWLHKGDYLFCGGDGQIDPTRKAEPEGDPEKTLIEFENKEKTRIRIKEEILDNSGKLRATIGFEFYGTIFDFITCDEEGTIAISNEFAEAIKAKIMPKVDVEEDKEANFISELMKIINGKLTGDTTNSRLKMQLTDLLLKQD